MRFTRIAASSLVVATAVAALAALVSCTSDSPSAQTAAAPSAEEQLARGKYLVTVMGCNDCHTPGTLYGAPDMTRMLSGSELGWPGPWGVACAANITPDMETGIGSWTVEQIVHAIRTGNRPDGRQLAGIMPWMNFASLTDSDAMAIATFLKSIPAVKHAVPPPTGPGVKTPVAIIAFPPPPAYDALNLPPPPTP